MNLGTYLEINLNKIEENSRRILEVCRCMDIQVLGVTKGFSAKPRIVEAMINGGIKSLADSRLENIKMLRDRGFNQSMTLLRIPRLSGVDMVVEFTDCSVNSEYSVIKGLSDEAILRGKKHNVVLMVDVGDLREGVLPEDALEMAKSIAMLKGVRLCGIGTNMGCYGGVLPTMQNLNLLMEVAGDIEKGLGVKLEVISGGGTSSLQLVESGQMPGGINQLRIGEGLLLGTDTTHGRIISWLHQDAFLAKTEVIELKVKPSKPIGETGRDSFGKIPSIIDKGLRKRAIVALGKQDVNVDGLIPIDPNMYVLGGSSDHIIIDVTDVDEDIKVGDQLTFKLNYQGLLFLCNSRYVKRVYK